MSLPPTAHRSAPDAEVTGLSACDLSAAIRARRLSCVEVMTAYLDRIDRINPHVNAIVSLQPREALLAEAGRRDVELAQARRDGRPVGWMHGFPQAPKDLAATVGIPTTQGSPLFACFVPTTDAIIVERARRSGAVLIGKTNTPEFGLGSHTYNAVFGITRNAFDPTKSAGGSSGGAAVALATDLLPVADGSDMMGSLRNPAGWNDVFGLRPSFGRVPYGPTNEVFFQQLGTVGPMGRSVADLAMLLSVQAGFDSRAPLSIDQDASVFATSLDGDPGGLRIGWLGDFDGYLPMEPGVMETCSAALQAFEALGCTVDAARPAFSMERLWQSWLVLRAFTTAGSLGVVHADPKRRALMKPEAVWEVEQGMGLSASQVHRATVDRSAWYAALDALFARFDFLVLPTAQTFPFDATLDWPKHIAGRPMDTYHRWMEVVVGATMAGLPALAVPAGFGPGGLPIGLQIIGRAQADLAVLRMGHAYEAATRSRATRRPAFT